MSHFGDFIKKERAKQGLSGNKLSKKIGISRQALAYIESGVNAPTLKTMYKICNALGADFIIKKDEVR